jgi:hypothetical protein
MTYIRLNKNDLPEPEESNLENPALATQEEVIRSKALQNQLNELENEHGSNLVQKSIVGGDGFKITDAMMKPF